MDKKGKETMRFTYKEWSDTIDRLACELLSTGSLKRGDRALLVYPPSIDFMIAFYACVRAGIIAVPVYPPNPTKLSKDIAQFVSIQGTSGASVALTSTSYNWAKKAGGLRNMFSQSKTTRWPELKWIVTDKTPYDKLEDKSTGSLNIQGEDVAFLQFTSGSTSAPKGVVVRHDNLAHNLTLISDALVGNDALDTPVVVSWLPQYHDMGLIGSWMGAMYVRSTIYIYHSLQSHTLTHKNIIIHSNHQGSQLNITKTQVHGRLRLLPLTDFVHARSRALAQTHESIQMYTHPSPEFFSSSYAKTISRSNT